MFDIAWSEMAIIAVVALVVIGPKDLPRVLRTVGQLTGKARAMAREFQNSIEELARESELESLKDEVKKATSLDPMAAVDPSGELAKTIDEVKSVADATAAPPVTSTNSIAPVEKVAAAPEPVPPPEPLPKAGAGGAAG